MITWSEFMNYSVKPGIKPRLETLFFSGFGFIAYFIALVYQAVRLLPADHPYGRAENMGKFGIRHVIAEAANNIVVSYRNIDQILLFFAILFGLFLVVIQIILMVLSLTAEPALADGMPENIADFFITPNPHQDLAYIFLDMVFGVPDIFDSCVSTYGDGGSNVPCFDTNGNYVVQYEDQWLLYSLAFPFPIHHALHELFRVYSLGLLVVAFFITMYFVVTVVAETAQSGTPFGRRFNKIWAPLRIVIAFGLLVPVGYGLNASQYIVLYSAKYGSAFASNGWVLFNETLNSSAAEQMSLIGMPEGGSGSDSSTQYLVSKPNIPEVGTLLQFMFTARTCAEFIQLHKTDADGDEPIIRPYIVKDPKAPVNAVELEDYNFGDQLTPNYQQLTQFMDGASQVVIRFGVRNVEYYPKYMGNVSPICGELIMPLTDPREPTGDPETDPEPGARIMQSYYWFIIRELWFKTMQDENGYGINFPQNIARLETPFQHDPNLETPEADFRASLQDFYETDINAAMMDPSLTNLEAYVGNIGAIPAQANAGRWFAQDSPSNPEMTILEEKGWAGAAIWYNKIAELNGTISSSILNIPMPTRYPAVMEYVKEIKKANDENVSIAEIFKPEIAGGEGVKFPMNVEDSDAARALYTAYNFWQQGDFTNTQHTAASGNVFFDAINTILGTKGLFNMRCNSDIHPLAQLVGVGRSLVESAIRNIGWAALGGMTGLLANILQISSGETISMVIGFLMTVALIALTAGFILYYVVPFLPFIYFFFAVGGWVKGIFEAMVGAPLWALAHIRIDGNGLSGQAAIAGYFLIFEIFLRPILIIFGLLASVSIFSAMVLVLNQTWDLVLQNVAGFDVKQEVVLQQTGSTDFCLSTRSTPLDGSDSLMDTLRGPIDKFFYTIVYTVVVYLMAMSSFKLIDLIPNNILRWMGQSLSTFNDQREDPAQGMIGTATIGTQQTLSQVGEPAKKGLQSMAKGFGP